MSPLQLFLFFLAAALYVDGAAAEPKTIKLCHEASALDDKPKLANIPLTPGKGLLRQIIKSAGAATGIKVEYHGRPWKRCIAEVSTGKADGLFAAIWQPERDQWGAFPKNQNDPLGPPNRKLRLWTAQYPIFVPADGTLQWNGSGFSNITHGIGAPLGYVAAKKLSADGVYNAHTLDPEHGFKLLVNHRLDGYVIETQYGHNIIQQLGLTDEISTLPHPYFEADWYLVLSHQYRTHNPSDANRLWQNLEKARNQVITEK